MRWWDASNDLFSVEVIVFKWKLHRDVANEWENNSSTIIVCANNMKFIWKSKEMMRRLHSSVCSCYHYDFHVSASFDENGVFDGSWRWIRELDKCVCLSHLLSPCSLCMNDGSIVNKWIEIIPPDAKHLNEVEQSHGICAAQFTSESNPHMKKITHRCVVLSVDTRNKRRVFHDDQKICNQAMKRIKSWFCLSQFSTLWWRTKIASNWERRKRPA